MADAKNAEKASETVKLVANARLSLPDGRTVEAGDHFTVPDDVAKGLVGLTAAKHA